LHPEARNFHAVWPSLLATSMGLMAFLPTLPLYVQERFGIDDPAELTFLASIIYGAAPFSAALAGPFWGALGDRLGKKPMAIRANFAIAITTALMPFAPSPLWLLAMRALQGVLAGYVAPAMALVTASAGRERHGEVIARLQVAMATGSFLGPYIGAEAGHWYGRAAVFWVASALSFAAALQLRWRAYEAPVVPPAGGPSVLRGFVGALGALLHNRVVAWLLVAVLVLRLGSNMLDPLLALVVRELGALPVLVELSADRALALDRTIAVPFAMLALAQWVCTRWWGRMADRHGPLRCLGLLALGLGAAHATTACVGTIGQFLSLRAVTACLMAGSLTLAYAAVSKRVADGNRTLAFAMVQSCIQFGLSLGPLLGAWMAAGAGSAVDFQRAFLLAAALCALAGGGMLVLRRWSARTSPMAATPGSCGQGDAGGGPGPA
jgi:MFS family permease